MEPKSGVVPILVAIDRGYGIDPRVRDLGVEVSGLLGEDALLHGAEHLRGRGEGEGVDFISNIGDVGRVDVVVRRPCAVC